MIFVSIALLAIAAVALGIGIASSSVPPLVISILATLAAGGTLWASFIHYRKEAAEAGAPVRGLGGNEPRHPGWPRVYVDGQSVPATPAVAAPGAVAPPAPNGSPSLAPEGWDELLASEAVEQVEAFNLEELHGLRRHEVEHEHRASVLQAIDDRIDELVALRKRLPAR